SRVHLVYSGQHQRLAKLLRQRVDKPVQRRCIICADGLLLRRSGLRRHRLCFYFGGFDCRSTPQVDGQPPGRTREEGPLVPHATPAAVAVELEEGLLRDVLGVMRVSQQREGYAEDEAVLPVNEQRELVIARGSLAFLQPVRLLDADGVCRRHAAIQTLRRAK